MDKKTIVVVGAGQGLGNHVAKKFGREGFRVVLMARNGESLITYQREFAAKALKPLYTKRMRNGRRHWTPLSLG